MNRNWRWDKVSSSVNMMQLKFVTIKSLRTKKNYTDLFQVSFQLRHSVAFTRLFTVQQQQFTQLCTI